MELIFSFVKTISDKFFLRKKAKDNSQIYDILSQLTHDLKNKFIAVRAVTGSISNNLDKMEQNEIQTKLASINQMVNHAAILIEMTKTLYGPVKNHPSQITTFSMLSCIQEAIQTYPFPSQKCLSNITILIPEVDFQVNSDKYLTLNILYFLIKNAVDTIYRIEYAPTTITLIKERANNTLCFRFPNTRIAEKNHFSIGSPENHGFGLKFIHTAMGVIGGKVFFEEDSKDYFLIKLVFLTNDLALG